MTPATDGLATAGGSAARTVVWLTDTDGSTMIFGDGFESGGASGWTSTNG